MSSKIVGILATAGLGLLLAGGVFWSKTSTESKGLLDAKTEKITGYISLDVEPVFLDPRIEKILKDNGLTVEWERVGSREMGALAATKKVDFFFPSGSVAGAQIQEATKKAGLNPSVTSPFNTPLIMASWSAVGDILQAEGIAQKRKATSGVPVYDVDFTKLITIMDQKRKWSSLKANEKYSVGKPVLISSTDPRKSNSAAIYMSLLVKSSNGGEYPSTQEGVQKSVIKIAPFFKRQGYQETYVNGAFDDWASIGIGKVPMAFIYEFQIISHALMKGGMPDGSAVLIPIPTVVNKEVFISLTPNAKKLASILESKEVQAIAAEYGFRGMYKAAFQEVAKKTGVGLDENIIEIADLPSPETMSIMLETIANQLKVE